VYTEVIQDGNAGASSTPGRSTFASSTAFSVIAGHGSKNSRRISYTRVQGQRSSSRAQSIATTVGVIKRLGVLAMNGCVEFDLSTATSTRRPRQRHAESSTGIGGSGDFARNSFISIFLPRPPWRPGRDISCVRPDGLPTSITASTTWTWSSPKQGLADLRGTSPKQRAVPDHRQMRPTREYRPDAQGLLLPGSQPFPGENTPAPDRRRHFPGTTPVHAARDRMKG